MRRRSANKVRPWFLLRFVHNLSEATPGRPYDSVASKGFPRMNGSSRRCLRFWCAKAEEYGGSIKLWYVVSSTRPLCPLPFHIAQDASHKYLHGILSLGSSSSWLLLCCRPQHSAPCALIRPCWKCAGHLVSCSLPRGRFWNRSPAYVLP